MTTFVKCAFLAKNCTRLFPSIQLSIHHYQPCNNLEEGTVPAFRGKEMEQGDFQGALYRGLIQLGKHTVTLPAFLLLIAWNAGLVAGAPGTTINQV